MKASVFVCVAVLLSGHIAEAKEKHHKHYHHVTISHRHQEDRQKPAPHCCPENKGTYVGVPLVDKMDSYLGTNPTGWAHQWCAKFLGMVLGGLGLPTSGSNAAISYAHYGHSVPPAPGAIAVMPHHVGVVRRVVGGGRVELVSGNTGGHRVGISVYSMHRILAFRAPA
jgi:hypothetical protein